MRSIISLIIVFLSLSFSLEHPDAPSGSAVFNNPKRPEKQIIRLIEQCSVKNPFRYQNLIIFPIVVSNESDTRYLTFEESVNNGFLEIRELKNSQVNKVRVQNGSKYYIFGLAGELILGAKQDRMLKEDVLIPPFSRWIEIPVYCTEHGRWTEQTRTFQSRGLIASGLLRARAKMTESQAEVWDGVGQVQDELDVKAPTKAFKEVYEAPNVKDQSQPYLKELLPIPKRAKNTIGVIVGVGDEIICADLFANHSLFERLWEKLLRSYVIDALSKPSADGISLDQASDFLKSVKKASFTQLHTVGAGRLIRINRNVSSGSALIFNNDVVHLDLFPSLITDPKH
ncbi:MAG: ARPP-1 family domain-containing protein [bacterium]